MRLVVPALAVLALSAAQAQADQFECESRGGLSAYPVLHSADHDHMRYAPAGESGPVRLFEAFAANFDDGDDDNADGYPDLTGNPDWVAYHLRGVAADDDGSYREPEISIERPSPWYRSADFVAIYEANSAVSATRMDDSYRGVGRVWNRGHFAMADHAQRISPEASCNTHVFWNASPQAAAFNQGPWLHLETYTAAAANLFGEVWIIAGPIWDAQPLLNIASAGEIPVAVPHAFFKVIVAESDGRPDVRALIYEHAARGTHGAVEPEPSLGATWVKCSAARGRGHVYDHRPALVPLGEVERRTGLRFLEGHPDRPRLLASAPDSLWAIPSRFWSGYRCGQGPADTRAQ